MTIKTVEITERLIRRTLSDMSTLETFNHPNIIRLYQNLGTQKPINFITDYSLGGTLLTMVSEDDPVQEEEAKKRFRQRVSVTKYCHNLAIVH